MICAITLRGVLHLDQIKPRSEERPGRAMPKPTVDNLPCPLENGNCSTRALNRGQDSLRALINLKILKVIRPKANEPIPCIRSLSVNTASGGVHLPKAVRCSKAIQFIFHRNIGISTKLKPTPPGGVRCSMFDWYCAFGGNDSQGSR